MKKGNSSKRVDDALIQRLYIAAPCDVPWDSMEGDERTRFCGQCKLNVYNISEMSTKEAATMVRQREGRLCLKYYQRKDGTIITENCPVGLRKVRDKIKRTAILVVMSLAWLGFISSARAQGLVGADVDARYGVPTIPGEVECAPTYHGFDLKSILSIASGASCFGLVSMIYLKRAKITNFGTMLLAIWAFAGFLFGGFGYFDMR